MKARILRMEMALWIAVALLLAMLNNPMAYAFFVVWYVGTVAYGYLTR